jgi:hypothetical protein
MGLGPSQSCNFIGILPLRNVAPLDVKDTPMPQQLKGDASHLIGSEMTNGLAESVKLYDLSPAINITISKLLFMKWSVEDKCFDYRTS